MLLLLNFSVRSLFLILALFFCKVMFLTKFTLETSLLDFWARSTWNVFCFTNLYLSWTSLWYLYFIFFIIIFYNNYLYSKFLSCISHNIMLMFVIYNILIYSEALYGNTFNTYLLLSGENINFLLKNSVNKIHPLLLYSSTSLFFLPLFSTMFFEKKTTIQSQSTLYWLIFYKIKLSILLILSALYLGSWWALQEGSWGGWWNWDASEFFGVLILYSILSLFHKKSCVLSPVFFFNSIYLNIMYLFIFFFLLQLNFTIISHNFGFRTLKFLNTEVLLFSFLLTFLIFYTSNVLHTKNIQSFFIKSYQLNTLKFLINYLLLFSFNVVILLSLLSFFLKTLLNFKFFFTFLSFTKLLIFLFFFIYMYIIEIRYYMFLILSKIFTQNLNLLLFSLYTRILFGNATLHYLINTLLLISCIYKYSIINNYVHTNYSNVDSYSYLLSLNFTDIELESNFITNTTSFESKSFGLFIQNNYVYQLYLINSSNFNFMVTTIDNLPSILNTFLIISLLVLVKYITGLYVFKK
jgi:hypothetical protein